MGWSPVHINVGARNHQICLFEADHMGTYVFVTVNTSCVFVRCYRSRVDEFFRKAKSFNNKAFLTKMNQDSKLFFLLNFLTDGRGSAFSGTCYA